MARLRNGAEIHTDGWNVWAVAPPGVTSVTMADLIEDCVSHVLETDWSATEKSDVLRNFARMFDTMRSPRARELRRVAKELVRAEREKQSASSCPLLTQPTDEFAEFVESARAGLQQVAQDMAHLVESLESMGPSFEAKEP